MSDLRVRVAEIAAEWENDAPDRIVGAAVAADLRAALAEFGPDAREGQDGLRERVARLVRVHHSSDPEHQARLARWWDEGATAPDVREGCYRTAEAVLAVVGRTVGAEEAWAEACEGFAWALDNGPADQAVEYVLAHNPYRTVTEGGEQDG